MAPSDVRRLMLGSRVDLGLDHEVGARRDIPTRKPTPTGTAAGICAGPASWPGSAPDGWRAQRNVLKDMPTTRPIPLMTLVGTAVAAPACAPADRAVPANAEEATPMWRDRDPYREHQYVPDTFWLLVAALLFAACGLIWLIGQVAAILLGPQHEHLPVRLIDMLGVLLRLPGTW